MPTPEGRTGVSNSTEQSDIYVDVFGRCEVIEGSSPLWGRFVLPCLRDLRERAMRSYRTIDRVGPSERDFASQSEIIVW